MQKLPNPVLAQGTSPGPKWVPIRQDWPWIAGTLTVAALAAALVLFGNKK